MRAHYISLHASPAAAVAGWRDTARPLARQLRVRWPHTVSLPRFQIDRTETRTSWHTQQPTALPAAQPRRREARAGIWARAPRIRRPPGKHTAKQQQQKGGGLSRCHNGLRAWEANTRAKSRQVWERE
eukprot:350984-Chlamydomonas_euryale.AAC.7